MFTDTLTHHGVKGMKWGVRKDRRSSSNPLRKKSSSKQTTRSTKASKKKKKVKIKELSDAELQKKINRLQMEKRYRDLKKDEISEGRRLAGDILKTVGKTVGVQVGTYAAAKVINSMMKDEVVRTNSSKKKNNTNKKAA